MLRTLAEKVEPKRSAIIAIDVQNDFCDSNGRMARNGGNVAPLQEMVPRLGRLIDAARVAGALVIWIQLIHTEASTSEPRWDVWLRNQPDRKLDDLHCRKGTWGADFWMLSPKPGEPIVPKHRYSAFIGTDLDLILRSNHIETAIVTGLSTHVCVESTARQAFMLDYYVVMPEDCCAAADMARHDGTLANIKDNFGEVCNSAEIMDVWSRTLAPATAG